MTFNTDFGRPERRPETPVGPTLHRRPLFPWPPGGWVVQGHRYCRRCIKPPYGNLASVSAEAHVGHCRSCLRDLTTGRLDYRKYNDTDDLEVHPD